MRVELMPRVRSVKQAAHRLGQRRLGNIEGDWVHAPGARVEPSGVETSLLHFGDRRRPYL